MNTEKITARIDQDFEIPAIRKRQERAQGGTPVQAPDVNEPTEIVDIYQQDVNERREDAKKNYPSGSSKRVLRIVQDAVNGDGGRAGLARAYRKARDDSELLRERGDSRRARWVKEQYMEESFLPVVEVVVNFTSPDELLNNEQALRVLDEYALTAGAGDGYTAAYVRAAYGDQLGQRPGLSDETVRDSVRRIKRMCGADNIRGAYALARKIRQKIDRGELMASSEDYDLILRVASFK